jgi:hypothetical protein
MIELTIWNCGSGMRGVSLKKARTDSRKNRLPDTKEFGDMAAY